MSAGIGFLISWVCGTMAKKQTTNKKFVIVYSVECFRLFSFKYLFKFLRNWK